MSPRRGRRESSSGCCAADREARGRRASRASPGRASSPPRGATAPRGRATRAGRGRRRLGLPRKAGRRRRRVVPNRGARARLGAGGEVVRRSCHTPCAAEAREYFEKLYEAPEIRAKADANTPKKHWIGGG